MLSPRLLGAVCAVAMLLAQLAPIEAAARELRLSHQLPETDARHKAARVLAAEVRKRVPDLLIKIHPELVPQDPADRAVRGDARRQDRHDDLPDGLRLGEDSRALRRHHARCAGQRGGGRAAQRLRVRGEAAAAVRGEGLSHPDLVVARRRHGEPHPRRSPGPRASRASPRAAAAARTSTACSRRRAPRSPICP